RVHVFNSRTSAFQADEVLQESLILHAVKTQLDEPVRITVSDNLQDPPKERLIPREDFCDPQDPDLFVHLITDGYDLHVRKRMRAFTHSLADLGLTVSTGRVVDFRAKNCLLREPTDEAVPLIYPGHCKN